MPWLVPSVLAVGCGCRITTSPRSDKTSTIMVMVSSSVFLELSVGIVGVVVTCVP